jgi:hypothetical protein
VLLEMGCKSAIAPATPAFTLTMMADEIPGQQHSNKQQ